MKTLRAMSGPFLERPYFTHEDIDQLAIEELQACGLFPDSPAPVRIERFIERRFKLSPMYEDLPADVLGYTLFGAGGVQAIVVSRALSEDGTRVSDFRLNTTLGHEAGHGLLHSYLFALNVQSQTMFSDADVNPTKILCRNQAVMERGAARRYNGRWWEYQANQCMSALLLPRPLVVECARTFVRIEGMMKTMVLPEEHREQAVRHVAGAFEVNPVVARIRIAELFPEGSERQMAL
jgi:hypothetical protein